MADDGQGSCVASLVMIVDDHAVIRCMLRAVFEAENLDVSDAVDGAEGVRKAQAEKPNLIILDLSAMNGLDAARELKVLMPHVPLLMFTNNAGLPWRKRLALRAFLRWFASPTPTRRSSWLPTREHFLD
jgi:CheY-like chemotaxis protein